MPDPQTWQIIATPADRIAAAVLLLNGALKFKGRKKLAALRRLREALGLVEPTAALLASQRVSRRLAEDRTTRNVFTVTAENADFMFECLEAVDLNGADGAANAAIIEQLEAGRPAGDVTTAAPYDPAAEDWTPEPAPLLEQPARFVEVFKEALGTASSFEDFRGAMMEEFRPAKPGAESGQVIPMRAGGGRLADEPSAAG